MTGTAPATPDLERLRAKAVAMGLPAAAIDGFVTMDLETLILQAALWHGMAIAHQTRGLDVEIRSGEVIASLFDLCRGRGIEVPDALYDAACAINARS